MENIKIIAHRGYLIKSDPENSIPAFHTAIEHGADGLEFDIHLTSDNKFVCFHDDTLEKLGRSELIKDLPQKELNSIELSEGTTIPTLEEILETFGNKVILNIEVKSKIKGGKELVNLIHQFDLNQDKLIVSSFHYSPLKDIKTYDPTIPTGLLCGFAKGQIKKAKELKCNALHPFYDVIPRRWIKAPYRLVTKIHKYYAHKSFQNARQSGLLIIPWTVNDKKFIKSAIRMNVNSIITDEVEKVLKIRKS